LDKALSPATEGMSMEESEVRNDDGKNNMGKTIPLIIPYKLMAASVERPYINKRAGIIAFSTVLRIAFKYDVADRGNAIPRILNIIVSDF